MSSCSRDVTRGATRRSMISHLALILFKALLILRASRNYRASLAGSQVGKSPSSPNSDRPPPPLLWRQRQIMVESQKPICSLTLQCPANTQVCVQGECLDFELSNDIWIVATVALATLLMVSQIRKCTHIHNNNSVSK